VSVEDLDAVKGADSLDRNVFTEHSLLESEIAREHGETGGGAVSGSGSLVKQMARVYLQNKLAVASAVLILVMIMLCVVVPLFYHSSYWFVAPTLTPQVNTCFSSNPALTFAYVGNSAPSSGHILGCTGGYDNFGLIFLAGRYSLAIGFLAAFVNMTLGAGYGIFSGFKGGKTDALLMRIVDVLLSVPTLYLLLLVIVLYGETLWSLVLVIGFTGWFGVARLMRSEAQVIREREYVQAATSMGSTRRRILWRHVLPNGVSTMVTAATFAVGDAVLVLATLGFLGLGLKRPEFDWGSMIQLGSSFFRDGEWWTMWPVAIIFIVFVLATNYIGDATRDAFEVRLQER
jgi:peptide/nickel transport system permease protein